MQTIRTYNEFAAFIDVVRFLGIKVNTCYELPKEPWQEILNSQGYKRTIHGCWGFQIGSVMFVFSSGKPHWLSDEESYGPESSFLFAYDTSKNEVIPRIEIDQGTGHPKNSLTGLQAMASQYSSFFEGMSNA